MKKRQPKFNLRVWTEDGASMSGKSECAESQCFALWMLADWMLGVETVQDDEERERFRKAVKRFLTAAERYRKTSKDKS